ncbi:MAG: DEAD/DEAH box helicase [Bacteroidia bacterium]|nr:DEAD/DEAH box helicase [Bacteroidia bacterium]
MEQKFIVAVSEHRLFGFLILPYLAEDGLDSKYLSISQRLRVHDLAGGNFNFSAVQTQLVKLTEKYADENLAKKYNKKGTLNDFYKNVKGDELNKKLVPFIEEIMVRCLNLLKTTEIPVYFKRAKYTNLYEEDLIEFCYNDTSAVFNFHKLEDETRYFLTIRHGTNQLSLLHRNIVLLVNEPCRILYQNKLYFFDDISWSKLMPFFDKEYISIPRTVEEKYFGSFILNAVKSQEVNYSGFEIIDIPARKEAILSVASDITGYPVFIPVFKYNDQLIPVDDEGKKVAVFEVVDGNYIFHRFEKDQTWEMDVISKLRELELQGEIHALHLARSFSDNQANSLYDAIGWISRNSAYLIESGITISQEQLDQKYFIGQQTLNLRISQTNDWFDIFATVTFGQFSFPFIRLRKNILNQTREFKLPDGEIAILPLEWFAKYHNIFSLGKVGEQSIRLQNYHFMLIPEIANEMEASVKERISLLGSGSIDSQDIPNKLFAELRNYQKVGYDWMYHLFANGLGGCLADDMGLGKTIQTLTLLLKLKRKEPLYPVFQHKKTGQLSLFVSEEPLEEMVQPATLIVLPVSLVHNWEKEIRKFAPSLKAYVYSGARRREKSSMNDIIANYDIILTTYGTVRNDVEELSQYEFFFLILDESQYIKNSESKTYKTITGIRSQHRIVLTGTPIENSLSDLWAQMNFLNRGLLGSKNYFKQEFLIPIERDKMPEASEKLQKLIHPFILRRTKEQVAKDLPSLTEETIVVEMAAEQFEFYETEKSAVRNTLLNNFREEGLQKSTFFVLQALMRLRQIAIHPRLIDPASAFESGKFNDIIAMLSILVAENHKILVFSSFVKHLTLLADVFKKKQWNYSLLTGKTTDRKQVIDEFQENPEKKIFLISLKAGGVGLNLTAADYIFITDPWWNPAAEMQAISRAHRIGQDKKVFVYRFISENSIEEKIQKLQEKKSKLANEFVNSNDPFRDISEDEVLDLFE